MSEAGWREFLSAEKLEDWVVLHGGPTAVFVTKDLSQSISLASSVSELPGIDEQNVHFSIVSNQLTVRLTREIWNIESKHIDLAREISRVARDFGVSANRRLVQEVQVAIAAKPDAIDLGFWRAILGYSPMLDDNGVDPLGLSSTVWMQDLDADKTLKHAMHLDVSVAREHIEERLAAAVASGGVVVDGSHAPSWWILADRSGNKVCLVAWPDGAKDPLDS